MSKPKDQTITGNYNFQQEESGIYLDWEKSGVFTPTIAPGKTPFTIIMPPPNANGQLHTGHAMVITLEDILCRFHRMNGEPTLWLPGADHAGIMTQVVYEKKLAKEGKSRFDLGREEFFKQTYDFCMQNKTTMEKQIRHLGASCDWTRAKFTLDPEISKAVIHTFNLLYKDGLIYRGERIINWCVRCGTTLSDLEVTHEEKDSSLWYIKYPLADDSGFITVATTRPETLLGDTAVAVNPKDARYKKLVGKSVKLPLTERTIPIIADAVIDKAFGTGAVKITPAHDPVDFEIGVRHNLPQIQVIGTYGKMLDAAGAEYAGLKVQEARDKVVAELELRGLLEKIEPHKHAVGACERCSRTVEPLVSKQWFIKVKPLAEKAIAAVRSGEIEIVPKRFEKIYFNWMENLHDWNISRQLWWGHRIPVWYCEACGKEIVAEEAPKKCPCGSTKLKQDEDTLDTWFSSGQWPFTTLGWPAQTADYKYFYPTSVMETGSDILFFWVARMIMLGLYCTGQVPFKKVYLNGLVRDAQGQKMSKSKGNVIDPLELAGKYGTDALRMALVVGTSPGNDVNLSEPKVAAYRNFANKVWNATRYVQMAVGPDFEYNYDPKKHVKTDMDEVMIKELVEVTKLTTKDLQSLAIARAGERLYEFFWHFFCDRYIENSKALLQEEKTKESTKQVLFHTLITSLKLLHPYVPFITEACFMRLPQKEGALISASWPKVK